MIRLLEPHRPEAPGADTTSDLRLTDTQTPPNNPPIPEGIQPRTVSTTPSFWTHDSHVLDSDETEVVEWPAQTFSPRVFATPVLIAVNLAAFVLMTVNGLSFSDPSAAGLMRWGADYGPLTTHGQVWRLLTAAFVHDGVFHLLINMVALAFIGRVSEKRLGSAGFVVLYLLSAIGGNLVSLVCHPFSVAEGASGAIFGILGGNLACRASQPNPISGRKALLAVLSLFVSAAPPPTFSEHIDIAGHLGGLAAGFLVGCALARRPLPATRGARLVRTFVVALAGAAIAIGGVLAAPRVDDIAVEAPRLLSLESRIDKLLNDSIEKDKAGRLRPEEFSKLVETEMLPPWNAERDRLSKLRFSERQRPIASATVEFMGLKAEVWSLAATAVRTNDPDMRQTVAEKERAAEAIAREIAKRAKSFTVGPL